MLNGITDEVATAHQPAPLNRPTAVLTGRGHAAVTLYRLIRQVRDLDAADRAYVLDMFREELLELPTTA